MKHYLLALPVICFAAPAYAQDAAAGGFRVEAMVGYDRIGVGDDLEDDDPTVAQGTGDIEGAFYGGTIGYDFGFGGVLVGVDAEFTQSDGDRVIFFNAGPPRGVQPLAEVEFGRDLYIGGRATFAVGPTFNVYGKVGYTNQRVSIQVADDNLQDELDELDMDDDTTLNGVRGALGLSYAPEGRASYGIELRYSNYENGVDKKQAALVVGFRF